MAKNDGLSVLRAEVKKLQRNAGNKISRLRTKQHVDIAGTPLDPRKPVAEINKARTRDLLSQKRKLEAFNARNNQYVPDAYGRAMPAKDWQNYKNLEAKYNQRVHDQFNRIADVFIPNTNETIRQRMEKVTPDRRQMANPTVNTPYKPPNRKPTNVRDKKALDKLTKDMRNRLNKDYDAKQLKASRDTWVKAAAVLNDPELSNAVSQLTPMQFGVLWGYTNFADITFLEYHLLKGLNLDKDNYLT
jgi:hypothetical protein